MEIYAEMTKNILNSIEKDHKKFILPEGVALRRKSGSRACYLECETKETKEELVDFLEASGISWQEND